MGNSKDFFLPSGKSLCSNRFISLIFGVKKMKSKLFDYMWCEVSKRNCTRDSDTP